MIAMHMYTKTPERKVVSLCACAAATHYSDMWEQDLKSEVICDSVSLRLNIRLQQRRQWRCTAALRAAHVEMSHKMCAKKMPWVSGKVVLLCTSITLRSMPTVSPNESGAAEVFALGLVWETIQHPGYDWTAKWVGRFLWNPHLILTVMCVQNGM